MKMWAVSDMLGDFWHWAVLTFRRFDIVSIGALNPVTGRSVAVSGDSARPGAACIYEVSARVAPTGLGGPPGTVGAADAL